MWGGAFGDGILEDVLLHAVTDVVADIDVQQGAEYGHYRDEDGPGELDGGIAAGVEHIDEHDGGENEGGAHIVGHVAGEAVE